MPTVNTVKLFFTGNSANREKSSGRGDPIIQVRRKAQILILDDGAHLCAATFLRNETLQPCTIILRGMQCESVLTDLKCTGVNAYCIICLMFHLPFLITQLHSK